MRRYLDSKPMDEVAMARLRSFETDALELHSGGYWLAFSGGKDSVVILDLARRAKVAFEAHFSYSAEAPEVLAFVRSCVGVHVDFAPRSMWQLIPTNGPPMRRGAWCCRELKERGGNGRITVTGIRSAESVRRRGRQVFERSYRHKQKWLLNPIVDWSTDAVWDYIHERHLPYCCLYDEGRRRVGCVMCPQAGKAQQAIDAERWPRFAKLYRKAMAKRWATSPAAQRIARSPDEFYEWWLSGEAAAPGDGECLPLFEDDPSMAEATP